MGTRSLADLPWRDIRQWGLASQERRFRHHNGAKHVACRCVTQPCPAHPSAGGSAAAGDPRRRPSRRPRVRPGGRRRRRREAPGAVRGHGRRAPLRHRGRRAPAAGTARAVAAAAGPGGRADRLRPRAAQRRLRVQQLPRERRRVLPRRPADRPHARVAGDRAGGLGPAGDRHGDAAGDDRLADAARHRVRARLRQGRRRLRGRRVLRGRRHEQGRRARGDGLRGDASRHR